MFESQLSQNLAINQIYESNRIVHPYNLLITYLNHVSKYGYLKNNNNNESFFPLTIRKISNFFLVKGDEEYFWNILFNGMFRINFNYLIDIVPKPLWLLLHLIMAI